MIKIVKESFSSKLPSWLVRDKSVNHILNDRGIDLHNATYVPDVMISSGRDKRLKDPNRLQVFRLGSNVFIPGVNNPYIEIGGRYGNATNFSFKSLAQYADEYGYIDLSDPKNTNIDIRQQRAKAKSGSVNRGLGQYKYKKREYDYEKGEYVDKGYEWRTAKGKDKSGYNLPDPDKYVKLLNIEDRHTYSRALERLYNKITAVRNEVNNIDFSKLDTTNDHIANNCYRYLNDIISEYRDILRDCNRILDPESGYSDKYIDGYFSGSRSLFDSFPKKVANIEDSIRRLKKLLSSK